MFTWLYEDMPGIDPNITQHRIPTLPEVKPVKQKLRCIKPEWMLKIKEEVVKQLKVGFIKAVELTDWVANIVSVSEKDGRLWMCMDFRDLNKACLNDDFPLPHIDVLVDNTTGSALISFMDGFSGYNQISMAPEDMTKTTFVTEWRIYCYTFWIEKCGCYVTRDGYHSLTQHQEVEVYVYDMIVKSKTRGEHLANLQNFLREYETTS